MDSYIDRQIGSLKDKQIDKEITQVARQIDR